MEGFGDDFVPVENDPAAEFIAQEQNQLADIDGIEPAMNNGYEEEPNFEATNGEVDHAESDPNEPSAPSPVPMPKVEPEKIRIWREKQEAMLKEKDEAEDKAKEELRQKAKKELTDWYQQHEEQLVKTRQSNRSAEKELVANTTKMEPGTEWDRISKLCDFNPKTSKSSRDVSRMRSIILHVKQNPPVKT